MKKERLLEMIYTGLTDWTNVLVSHIISCIEFGGIFIFVYKYSPTSVIFDL